MDDWLPFWRVLYTHELGATLNGRVKCICQRVVSEMPQCIYIYVFFTRFQFMYINTIYIIYIYISLYNLNTKHQNTCCFTPGFKENLVKLDNASPFQIFRPFMKSLSIYIYIKSTWRLSKKIRLVVKSCAPKVNGSTFKKDKKRYVVLEYTPPRLDIAPENGWLEDTPASFLGF